MLFNSYEFLLFFPIVCLVYFVIPKKFQQVWLLIASYFFYMCWNARYALLLLFVTVVTFICGMSINRRGETKKARIWPVILGFILCLAVLFLFKYVNFFGSTGNYVLQKMGCGFQFRSLDLVLPVGISFYTFQALSYLVDVYRGEVDVEKSFIRFALFVSFFPQLVAGPIERSKNLLKQVKETHSFDYDRMRDGLLLMIWGFFLKLVIADRAAIYVDRVYGSLDSYGGEFVLMAAILFSIQIYCDFAGYSIIAIGAAKVMGFALMENFNRPYLSSTVGEFWRNWHISLTSWFRDYLYVPLGGNRKGKLRKYINIMIVFLVSGLWHGAGWHFIVWGGLNGMYQVIGEMGKGVKSAIWNILHVSEKNAILNIFRIVTTCVLVGFAWIFFRAESLGVAISAIKSIITMHPDSIISLKNVFKDVITYKQSAILIVAIIVLFISDILKKRKYNVIDWIVSRNIVTRWVIYIFAIMFIVIFGVWGPDFSASNFIYFQF